MVEDYITKFEETMNDELMPRRKRFGLAFCALFIVMLGFVAVGCTSGGNVPETPTQHKPISTMPDDFIADDSTVETGLESNNVDSEPSSDVDVVPSSSNNVIETPVENTIPEETVKSEQSSEDDIDVISNEDAKMVSVSVAESGRNDPFVPISELKSVNGQKDVDLKNIKLKYDLVDPPNSSKADSDAEKILTTKVSGIMYDPQSPSAILNIESSDYLVRSGDIINGYKVLAIEPTIVTVQLGANIYKAGVGELLVTDGIQYNTVSNLDKKFGGSKKEVK